MGIESVGYVAFAGLMLLFLAIKYFMFKD